MSPDEFDKLPNYKKRKICQKILYNTDYLNKQPLSGDDFDLMLHVFKNHPEAETKLSNIDRIEVRPSIKSRRYSSKTSYCFHILYKDGLSDDISYRICLDKNHNKNTRECGPDKPRYLTMTRRVVGLRGVRAVPRKVENLEAAVLNESLPKSYVVYFLWEDDHLIYIGRSNNLLRRMQCDGHSQINEPHKKYISYIECNSYKQTIALEAKYIRKLTPLVPSLINNCVVAKKIKRDLGLDK